MAPRRIKRRARPPRCACTAPSTHNGEIPGLRIHTLQCPCVVSRDYKSFQTRVLCELITLWGLQGAIPQSDFRDVDTRIARLFASEGFEERVSVRLQLPQRTILRCDASHTMAREKASRARPAGAAMIRRLTIALRCVVLQKKAP